MSYPARNTHFIIKRASLLCGLLFAAAFALLPISAQAQTQGDATYNYGGKWILHQTGLSPITMEIRRIGSEITGEASYDAGRKGIARGTVQGRAWSETYPTWLAYITKNHFEVEIKWHDEVGVYRGTDGHLFSTIDSTPNFNSLRGEAWSKAKPDVKVGWYTDEVFPRVPPPVQSPAPPKPPRSSGKMPKSEPAPAPIKAPGILASQVVFDIPFQPTGFVILTWDAGSDHPDAAVWVKINNGAPTLLVKGMKGGSRATVERGRNYVYLLEDGGKTLATVGFSVP